MFFGKLLEGGSSQPPPSYVSFNPEEIIPQYDGNETLDLSTDYQEYFSIPVLITDRPKSQKNQLGTNRNNLITIRRNNKYLEAANLPTIITLNPRSLYNKQSCFRTLIDQTEADVCLSQKRGTDLTRTKVT